MPVDYLPQVNLHEHLVLEGLLFLSLFPNFQSISLILLVFEMLKHLKLFIAYDWILIKEAERTY